MEWGPIEKNVICARLVEHGTIGVLRGLHTSAGELPGGTISIRYRLDPRETVAPNH